MSDRVPRRLKRFERKGELPPEEEEIDLAEPSYAQKELKSEEVDKEITMQLALDEVKRFKEEHKRLPKKEEYDQIAESIYSQLRDEEQRKKAIERYERRLGKKLLPSERAELRAKRRHERPLPGERAMERKKESALAGLQQAAKGLSEEDIKGMSVQDLFGEKKKPSSAEGLFGLEEGKKPAGKKPGEDEFSLGGLTDFDSAKEEPGEKCPKCGTSTDQVIFCPECGTAFCESCAKEVKKLGDSTTYVCPECKTRIKK